MILLGTVFRGLLLLCVQGRTQGGEKGMGTHLNGKRWLVEHLIANSKPSPSVTAKLIRCLIRGHNLSVLKRSRCHIFQTVRFSLPRL